MDKEYGNPYRVLMVYLSQINEWPVVKQDDSVWLKKFSLFLTKCKMLCNVSLSTVLNVVQKLPLYLQNKWREHVAKLRLGCQNVQFQNLTDFVTSASDIANDPMYGKVALSQHHIIGATGESKSKSDHAGQMASKSSSFATAVSAVKCSFLRYMTINRLAAVGLSAGLGFLYTIQTGPGAVSRGFICAPPATALSPAASADALLLLL